MCLLFCILHSECPSNIAFFSRGIKICLGGCQAWIVNVPISPGCPPVRQKNCFLTPDTPISFNSQNSTQLSRLKLIFRWSSISSILPIMSLQNELQENSQFFDCVFTWCVNWICTMMLCKVYRSRKILLLLIVNGGRQDFLEISFSHWFDWKLV